MVLKVVGPTDATAGVRRGITSTGRDVASEPESFSGVPEQRVKGHPI